MKVREYLEDELLEDEAIYHGYTIYDLIDERLIDNIESALKEYARQKCKEQRQICAESGFDVSNGEYTFEDIENAPEPEFD